MKPPIQGGERELLRWHKRLFVQGVERHVLSQGPASQANAPLLWRTLSDRRDQQHVLPHADGVGPASVGERRSHRFQVYPQGAAADHAQETAQGRKRFGVATARSRRGAEGAPRSAAISVAAELEEGRVPAARVSRL